MGGMKIVSLFSGCGGMDLGFEKAGFSVIFQNDNNKAAIDTLKYNFDENFVSHKDIRKILSEEIPDCDGIIGGPPCQSWSIAGKLRGSNDPRGQLIFDFIRIISAKRPNFFVMENVSGMLLKRHQEEFENIKLAFENLGYAIYCNVLNACDYGVPQDRKRLFVIGIIGEKKYCFPKKVLVKQNLMCIKNIPPHIKNQDVYRGSFSSIYMSRNRVRSWQEQSYTVQASCRHAPIHPQAPKMKRTCKDKYAFDTENLELYRRMSIREIARIQTFPDTFQFIYNKIPDGYKMVGNAVPVLLAQKIAESIREALDGV